MLRREKFRITDLRTHYKRTYTHIEEMVKEILLEFLNDHDKGKWHWNGNYYYVYD